MTAKCNRDCFNCTFADCIEDELSEEDYRELRAIDKNILKTSGKAQDKKQRKHEWYMANRTRILARQKLWYEAHRTSVAVRQRAYYEAHREAALARQREWREKRRKQIQ